MAARSEGPVGRRRATYKPAAGNSGVRKTRVGNGQSQEKKPGGATRKRRAKKYRALKEDLLRGFRDGEALTSFEDRLRAVPPEDRIGLRDRMHQGMAESPKCFEHLLEMRLPFVFRGGADPYESWCEAVLNWGVQRNGKLMLSFEAQFVDGCIRRGLEPKAAWKALNPAMRSNPSSLSPNGKFLWYFFDGGQSKKEAVQSANADRRGAMRLFDRLVVCIASGRKGLSCLAELYG